MINNIILDVGGVILLFKKHKLAEIDSSIADIPKYQNVYLGQYFFQTVAASPRYIEIDKGTITLEQFTDDFCAKTGEPKHLVREIFDVNKTNTVNTKLMKLMRKYKRQGKRLFILSNMGKERIPHIKGLLDNDLFDDMVFSSELGMVKPNADIFHFVLHKWEISPNECLFIDDNKNNIKTFQKFGGNAYLYINDDLDKCNQEIENIIEKLRDNK